MRSLRLRKRFSASVKTGIIAFAFLFAGFQFGELFSSLLHTSGEPFTEFNAALNTSLSDAPAPPPRASGIDSSSKSRKYPSKQFTGAGGKGQSPYLHSRKAREVESFSFNPNTVSGEDLQRLGFTEKQAGAIINYRQKGGRFRRKSDFASSFVVSDSVFRRLEPYIEIPLVDLNEADSAALDDLPGIGPYFVSKIIAYRSRLGGFSYQEQLMDIKNFDSLKYDAVKDLIYVGHKRIYPLWTLPEDSLVLHPYIGKYAARGIILYKENTPPEEWSVENLDRAGILKAGMAEKLSACLETVMK